MSREESLHLPGLRAQHGTPPPEGKPPDLPGLPAGCSSPLAGNTSTSFQNTRSRPPGRCAATRLGRSRGAHAASLEGQSGQVSRHVGRGQEGRARGGAGMCATDLSSCCWKCWTFIWCTVLFRSHRNLQGGRRRCAHEVPAAAPAFPAERSRCARLCPSWGGSAGRQKPAPWSTRLSAGGLSRVVGEGDT